MTHAPSAPAGAVFDRLAEDHLAELAQAGYAGSTLVSHCRALVRLGRLAADQGLAPRDLTPERVAELMIERPVDWPRARQVHAVFATRRFAAHLVERGIAVPPPPTPEQAARAALREEYEAYLRHQRGLSERSIKGVLRIADQFLARRFGERGYDLAGLTAGDVADYLLALTDRRPPYRDKTPPSHLRAFLTFLFRTGRTRTNLALSVPKVAQHYAARLPRHLSTEDVERVIAAVPAHPRMGRRNRAMVLVLARLGLRAREAVAIRLDDIDWRAGELTVRGKGERRDRMPIPADVGEAIVDYLRHERRGGSRALFVRSRPPYEPFEGAQICNAVLQTAFAAAGLALPPRHVGSHVLRHSLATELLRRGASLDEVGDVLRHRSRSSTMIYAKVDLDGLRAVAGRWPGLDADGRDLGGEAGR